MNIEDIEFQMDPDSSNFKTETNHILEDGNFLIFLMKIFPQKIFTFNLNCRSTLFK